MLLVLISGPRQSALNHTQKWFFLVQGWILCQKIEFWAPHPKKTKKQSHLRILGPPPPLILGPHPIFWAPNGFWGPQIDPTPPIKCKTLQIWPTLK